MARKDLLFLILGPLAGGMLLIGLMSNQVDQAIAQSPNPQELSMILKIGIPSFPILVTLTRWGRIQKHYLTVAEAKGTAANA